VTPFRPVYFSAYTKFYSCIQAPHISAGPAVNKTINGFSFYAGLYAAAFCAYAF
jgi:hypothetical protein